MAFHTLVILLVSVLKCTSSVGISVTATSPRAAFRAWSEKFAGQIHGLQSGNFIRYKTFLKNFQFVQNVLAKENTFGMELNEFADMSDDELKLYTGLNISEITSKYSLQGTVLSAGALGASAPSEKDHRFDTGLTVPRTQGYCGACWAFSSVAVVESRYKALTDEIVLLSEQELVDCAYKPDNRNSCNGGFMTKAFSYLQNNGRLSCRRDYSYEKKFGSCRKDRYKNGMTRATVSSYRQLSPGDNNLVMEVANNGPVSVAIHSTRSLNFYKYGVFDGSGCAGQAVNHAVVVVGYKPNRWIIRNSWGEAWGMFGYAYFTRAFPNVCQISTYPVTATLKKTANSDDQCVHVPEHHRQPCWDTSLWLKDQYQCERQGCCWDPNGVKEKCFVKAKITLYTKNNYEGVSATFYGGVADLYEYDFKAIAHSLKVHYGNFIAYEKTEYGKHGGWSLAMLNPGGIPDLAHYRATAAISSLKPIPGGEVVTLFKDSQGRGESISIHKYKTNVGGEWNDEATSIYSERKVDVCKDTSFRKCSTISSGFHGQLDCNDCLSSVRIVG